MHDTDHKEAIRLFVVVAHKLAEHLRETSVVRSSANEAQAENGIESDGEVVVVVVVVFR